MMKEKGRGFTLIEVLIVVVIIAILASLTLPRFISQPERAVIAEAQNYLGALRRLQMNLVDMGTNSTWKTVSTADATNDGWRDLGLKEMPNSKFFNYECTADNLCKATRKDSTTYENAIVELNETGGWKCTKYVADSYGCKPAA